MICIAKMFSVIVLEVVFSVMQNWACVAFILHMYPTDIFV